LEYWGSLGWRPIAASLFLGAAFVASCFFWGMPVNAIVFAGTVTAVVLAAALVGARALAQTMRCQPGPALVAGAFVLVILVNYQWSISKDMSFAGGWSLALLPLGFFVTASLPETLRWRLFGGIGVVV
jgi:hypothetical protein